MPAAVTSHATPSQIAVLPNEVMMAAESQWLFTEQELLRSPSILDGLPPEKERENRTKGVNFIVQVGIMLKLPQITLATASIYLHRFYMRRSMPSPYSPQGYHYYSIAATSLFLATKVEENCRKMKELVIACVRVAQKDPYRVVDEQDKEYWRWRDNILVNEDILLEALCFDLRLEAPYKILYDILSSLGQEDNKALRNAAWAFISDSCLTALCLLFSSRIIASSSLYAAARHSGVSFPDAADGRPWWEGVGVDLASISKACNYMADAYRGAPFKGGRDFREYETTPRDLDPALDATRAPSQSPANDMSTSALKRPLDAGSRVNGVDALAETTNGNSPKRLKTSNGHDHKIFDNAHGQGSNEDSAAPLEGRQQDDKDNNDLTCSVNSTNTLLPSPRPTNPVSNHTEGLISPTMNGKEDGELE